jgi:hypothetical protein
MKDVYVEWLINRRPSKVFKALKALCIVMLVLVAAAFLLTFNVFLMVGVVAMGFATHYANSFTKVEYEYIYVNGDMAVDRILNKSSRKRLIVFDMSKVEIVAQLGSPKLDGFAHKDYKQVDYTSGVRKPGSHIFVMYYGDGQKVLLEPNRELVEAMRDKIPHKVHMEI